MGQSRKSATTFVMSVKPSKAEVAIHGADVRYVPKAEVTHTMGESSDVLATICTINPFTHAVEAVRFALYLEIAPLSLAVVAGVLAAAGALTVIGYDPGRGLRTRQGPET